MKRTTSGFTIVELLIVIVVIAILAAISIVAYNGIQQRSRNTQTIAGVKQYINAIRMYAAENGTYPAQRSCLGDGYSYNGTPGICGGETGIYTDVAFDTALSKYLGSKPRLDTTNLTIRTSTTRAGGYHDPSVSTHGVVYYILAGTTASCDAGGSKTLSNDPGVNAFYCTYVLPTP